VLARNDLQSRRSRPDSSRDRRRRAKEHEWLDTVNVRAEGSVDLIVDFTDPIIRGVSLFHSHLLNHEDKGMMAKILFEL
jgi:FtsP/CotA-like multicopper oxidase with cupredoxin domain